MPTEMQPTLLIAAGDYLNGDEAVSHRVLSLLGAPDGVAMCDVLRWSGELAPRIAGAEDVVFVAAEDRLGEPRLEPVDAETATGQIVDRARRDYQFRGRAYHCHVPGLDFGRRAGGLSAYAESRAREAARILRKFLSATA